MSEDYLDSPEYQQFVEECATHCHCTPESSRPCDGCLAGGICDDMHWDELNDFDPVFDKDTDPWGDDQP